MKEAVATISGQVAVPRPIVEHEILTIREVAQLLRVPVSTIYKLARAGHIPASKIGKHWRFTRRGVDEWVHRAACVR